MVKGNTSSCYVYYNGVFIHSVGTSDPYCVVSILNKEHIDTKLVCYDNIKEWKEEGLITQTWQSTIKMKTLNPDWNETFEMYVRYLSLSFLNI